MFTRFFALLITAVFFAAAVYAQYPEKVVFDTKDSTGNTYLAVPPLSHNIKGVVVVLYNFYQPDNLVPETKLHNVACANDLLTVFVPMKEMLYADTAAVNRVSTVLQHVVGKYKADTSKFVLAGYDYASNIALRYTELTQQFPAAYAIHPKAVFTVSGPVDLFGLWDWCQQVIRKHPNDGQVGDAGFIIDKMTREIGTPFTRRERYQALTPFNSRDTAAGNEQYLQRIPVRVYYDTDIAWLLKERRNSLYDTYIPDATELVSRLLLAGNADAEFIEARQPGKRINGSRYPEAFSIVDETECIQWIKHTLDIFDPVNWQPPYKLDKPKGWGTEHFEVPVDFAPEIRYKGVEDIRFAPGWGDSSSAEHWSYAFLWWLKDKPVIDAPTLNSYLTAYYNGLVNRNIIRRQIPAAKQVPTVVNIKKVKTLAGDIETYGGSIRMLNYMVQRPVELHCTIHVKHCEAQERTALFFEISPQPATHIIWQQMDQLWSSFRCE